MMKKPPHSLFALFSFLLSAISFLVQKALTTAGYLTLNAANNLANTYTVDLEQAQEMFRLYKDYQFTYHHTYYEWTIGTWNNVPAYASVLFLVSGIVFTALYLQQKKKQENK